MGAEKERKLSKNQRHKARRYGKTYPDLQCSNNKKSRIANTNLPEFILSLPKGPNEEDHSLDELEFKKRPWWILSGSFEMGKRR
jgi:hypothetical protein